MLEMGLAAGGMVMSLMGKSQSATASNSYYQNQQAIGQDELSINQQKRNAMEIDARRRSLEMVRNNQKARSLAQTSATTQGAQFGSGLQGAYGGISGQGQTNLLGVNQNLEIGRNIFNTDTDISNLRIQDSGLQSSMNQGNGLAALGGAITGSAGKIGQMGQSVNQGNFNLFSMFQNNT